MTKVGSAYDPVPIFLLYCGIQFPSFSTQMESFGGRDDINFTQDEDRGQIDALGVSQSEFVHRFTDIRFIFIEKVITC